MADVEYTADRALSKANELAEILTRALQRERAFNDSGIAKHSEIKADLAALEAMTNPWSDFQTGQHVASLDTIDRLIKELPIESFTSQEMMRLEQIIESADDRIAAEVNARLDAKA